MDREEKFVLEFLQAEEHEDIVYEPDGNVPPDFSIGGRKYGVEVRRLNQQYQSKDGSVKGLEEDDIPLLMSIRKTLEDLGPPRNRRSWFVSYYFRRPLAPISTIRTELRDWLIAFREEGKERDEATLPSGVQVRVFPAGAGQQTEFLLGLITDSNSGGWVLDELERNIAICVAEKTQKVTPYANRYDEWWLALVDYINYGESFSQDQFARCGLVTRPWSRIVIINPLDPARSFELS